VRLVPDEPVAASIKASASYGNVRLQVPGGSRFELHASADPGDLSVSVPGLSLVEQSQQRVRGTLGQGGPHVELQSRHGDVKVTEAVGVSSDAADDE
jgi:hypothetical protein